MPPEDPVIEEKPSEIEVDLDKQPELPAPSTDENVVEMRKEIKHLQNQLAGNQRILTKLQKAQQQLVLPKEPVSSEPAPVSPASEPVAGSDEYYQKLADDGKAWEAVRQIQREEYKRLREQELASEAKRREINDRQAILQESSRKVVERFPELDPETGDPESQTNQLYQEVLNSDPRLLSNPYGPELAMHRTEQLAATRGIKLTPSGTSEPAATPNSVRRGRVPAAALPSSRASGATGNRVTLDADQKAFCDAQGVSYEDYARTTRDLESNGGISV